MKNLTLTAWFVLCVWVTPIIAHAQDNLYFGKKYEAVTHVGMHFMISLWRWDYSLVSAISIETAQTISGRFEADDWAYRVGGVLVGYLAKKKYEDLKKNGFGKSLYVSSVILSLAHGGLVDALIWEPDKNRIPEFLESDKMYLGGSAVLLTSNLFTANKWKSKHKRDFWFTTVGSIFIGSVMWDWTFSKMRYDDFFYPLPNWYGGVGFENKQTRIAFDVARLVVGSALIYLSDK